MTPWRGSAGCSRTRQLRRACQHLGAGVLANAPNRDNAVRFLEYLASDAAQEYLSEGNDE
jgi:ABC-type molybdate transport system substrate-binding protein